MAKQTIDIGAAPNDDTGTPVRDSYDITNDNFDELYLDKFNNVVIVNSASDFPAAVAGVRELIPTPGDKITYILDATEIDMGSDRFTVTSGDLVIIGTHRSASRLKTTNTGTFFTCVDSGTFLEKFGITCALAEFIDFSVPTAVESFVGSVLTIFDCDTIGTFSGAFTTSLRTMTVVDTQTGGLTWTGTDGTQINISNFFGASWTGTLFDLGTATFDIINISSGNRYLSPSGTTILSGAAASANLKTNGRSLVDDNIFNGLGTALSGITPSDLQWNFHNNVFGDNVTLNTINAADAFLSATTTVTITTQSVFVAVGGSNWLSTVDLRFTIGTDGQITYIGLETRAFSVAATATVAKVGGGTDQICTKIALDSGSGYVVSDKTLACTENATATGITSIGFFSLSTGDKLQLFCANEGSTANITVSSSSMFIQEVV